MSEIFIFGTGEHSCKTYFYSVQLGFKVKGFIDEFPNDSRINEVPVFTKQEILAKNSPSKIFIAIGNPSVRERLFHEFKNLNWELINIIHPTSYIAPDVNIGRGVLVAAGAIVETGSHIGDGAIVDIGSLADHCSMIPPFHHLRPGVLFQAKN